MLHNSRWPGREASAKPGFDLRQGVNGLAARLRLPLYAVCGVVIVLLAGADDLWAQERGLPSGEPPVIAAPSSPARTEPASSGEAAPSTATPFNSFAAGEVKPPPINDFIPEALPVVIELFTSQGCSSCPPADAMLANLVDEPNVIPLSMHVDYWDYLGWADSFAKAQFTKRQEAYAMAAGERTVYTPQLIIGGEDTAVAPGPAEVMSLINAHRASPALISTDIERTAEGNRIEIIPLTELQKSVDVNLVRYVPERTVQIQAGENRGRQMTYVNVVLSIEKLADWDGRAPLVLTIRSKGQRSDKYPEDTRHIILVQKDLNGEGEPGPILAAIGLD